MFEDLSNQPVRRWQAVDALLVGLFVFYLLAGILFNAVIPLGEAPDEPAHFDFVRYVARHRRLPVMAPRYEDNATLEAFQPPLYYVVAAPVAYPFADDAVHTLRNPAFRFGLPLPFFLHHPEHSFPGQGGDLAWHLLRFLSLIIGAMTLWVVYRVGLLALESRWLALAMVAYLALNPQYVYLHSSVTNDVLATLMGNVLTLSSLWLLRRPTVKKVAVVGLVVGLSALTKSSTLTLIPGLIVAILAGWRTFPSSRARWLAVAALVAIPLACSGWWFLRNQHLYGDPLGLSVAKEAMPANYYGASLTLGALVGQIPAMFWQTFKSSWGYFGWLSIALPNGLFILILLVHLLALAGLLATIKRTGFRQPTTLVLAATALGALAGFLLYARDVNSSGWHGRFLFPAASVVAVGFVGGWRSWFKDRERLLAILVMGSGLLLMVVTLIGTLFPTYLPPRFMPPDEVVPNPVDLTFGSDLRLIGYEIIPRDVEPGDRVDVTLYWMINQPARADYRFFVGGYTQFGTSIVTRSESLLSQRYPPMLWPEDRVVADRYRLYAAFDQEQVVGQIYVEVFDGYDQPEPVGEPLGLAQIAVRSELRPQSVADDAQARFDDGILLARYTLTPETVRAGESVTVTLHWQTEEPPTRDYQVFVHLLDAEGTRIAQHDGQPCSGLYPTSVWRAGESILDSHPLVIPSEYSGAAQFIVGLYTLDTMARLPVVGPDGLAYPDNTVPLTSILIERSND